MHRCTQMHYRLQIWTPICPPGCASMHTGLPCGATWASQCAPRCAPMHTSALSLVDLDTHMSTWVCFSAHQAAVWSLMSLPGCPSVFTDAHKCITACRLGHPYATLGVLRSPPGCRVEQHLLTLLLFCKLLNPKFYNLHQYKSMPCLPENHNKPT